MRGLRLSLRAVFYLQIICFQLVILHVVPQAPYPPLCSSEQNCANVDNLPSRLARSRVNERQNSTTDGGGCNKNCKIAIGVSVPVVFIAIILLLVWIYYKRRPYYTRSFRNVSRNRILTERVHALSKKFGPVAAAEFSFAKLSKATNSFADENMIGDGGFGAVYLGVLKAGHKVAVKRLYHDNFKRIEHFYNEIRILSSLDHPNLVKLYGFCCQDQRDLLLVFEYASNGTVFDQLHDPERPPMPWSTRLNIARETAEALCYLHNSVSPPIYHRDVKTSNILLDDKLHVKLADFGLSRMVPLEASHVSTVPQGSPGYLDPDYHHCYQLTNKSDVYSFGVVLVELVSAKLAVDMSRDRREINLSSMALMKIGCGMWQDLVDPRLEMSENSQVERTVKQVLELSFLCLNEDKDSRPTIDYVVDVLRRLCKESGFDSHYDNSFLSTLDARHPLSVEDEGRQSIDFKSSSRSRNLIDFSLSSTDELNSQSSLL
ncbi:hypothetical protein KP509_24G017700 [Ceratopteris richardii]|uniref:Protein kinase domain-containing protein n=1 Tax=Ceratopteris richardii TaxID=49495 RepID=A0A8T2RTK5_CERRI|nr:hypothetical protein KP509_24G017700 [Ceratopteris richardii]